MPHRAAHRRASITLATAAVLVGLVGLAAPAFPDVQAASRGAGQVVRPISAVSRACPGQNAEVQTAIDPHSGYLYEEWMGCSSRGSAGSVPGPRRGFPWSASDRSGLVPHIGFARSEDGGKTFSRGFVLPDSGGSWDPAVAVGPTGTVYAAFMVTRGTKTYPIVDISTDGGQRFSLVRQLVPPRRRNWGDRDFIAVSATGTIYVTWDYAPEHLVRAVCSPTGSCSFVAGELNAVVQKSTDGGRTWSKIIPISPGFPASGADSAPVLVEPGGRVDVLYQGYQVLNHKTLRLGVAHSYYTSSTDGGLKWSRPQRLGPASLSMSNAEWWIDGDLGLDSAGNLYATWDTQGGGHDVGWLAFSTTHGRTWSRLVRVTPDRDSATHIVQVLGGGAGTAYIGWLTDGARCGKAPCYGQYLRAFSIRGGWLTPIIAVSRKFGNWHVWPGDTIGMSLYPGGTPGNEDVAVSWGSAIGSKNAESQIWATVLSRLP